VISKRKRRKDDITSREKKEEEEKRKRRCEGDAHNILKHHGIDFHKTMNSSVDGTNDYHLPQIVVP
jgi:hypothetical protein